MFFSKQYFWNVEILWEKFFLNVVPCIDFFPLKEKYLDREKRGEIQQKFLLCDVPDFRPSREPVFEDENKKYFFGLQNFSLCFQSVGERIKPIYYFDNHNEALFPFLEIFNEYVNNNKNFKKLTIVHIDAHRDNAQFPQKFLKDISFELSFENVQKIISYCRVSDYLDIGKKIGLIGEIISLTQERECKNFLEYGIQKLIKNKIPYVLNLDIDIYGHEGSVISSALKTRVIAKAWAHSDAVCFATSPGFVDPQVAEKLGNIFFNSRETV